jgi:hypothetical protein
MAGLHAPSIANQSLISTVVRGCVVFRPECVMFHSLCKTVRCFALAVVTASAPALAGGGNYETTRAPYVNSLPDGAHAFYAEFRGRNEDGGFGHAYVVLGARDAAGHRHDSVVFGFVPKGPDDERWSQIAIPVEGLVGVSRSDFSIHPDVRYRVSIRRQDYHRVLRELRTYHSEWRVYALIGQNCNDLVGTVARSLGLDAPLIALQMPTSYVAELRALNAK